VPTIDIERAHDDVQIRLRGRHEISYLLVGREENAGLPLPQLLRNRCIHVTAGLPKSGLQILDPQWYQRHHLDRNLAQPARFAVVFDANFPAWSPQLFDEAALLHVIYWASNDAAALRCLANIEARVAIVPMLDGLKDDLLKAGVTRRNIVEDADEIYDRIEQEAVSHIHSGSARDSQDRIAANRRIAEVWRDEILPGRSGPSIPWMSIGTNSANCWDSSALLSGALKKKIISKSARVHR
jgi:hypothetical protein